MIDPRTLWRAQAHLRADIHYLDDVEWVRADEIKIRPGTLTDLRKIDRLIRGWSLNICDPLRVSETPTGYVCTDGCHRLTAFRRSERSEGEVLPCRVTRTEVR